LQWNQVNAIQKSDPLTYQGYAGAMASFVQTGDPNTHKLTNVSVPDVPNVEKGKQFVVTSQGLKQGPTKQLEERCAFWLDVSKRVPI
jgi:hypothetical protein